MSQQPPPTTPIIIYGASDHGRVILDILKKTHPNTPILFFDDHRGQNAFRYFCV